MQGARVVGVWGERGRSTWRVSGSLNFMWSRAMLLSRLRRLLLTGSRSNSVHDKRGGQRATSVAFGGAGDALHPGAVRSNSTMGSAPGAGASSDLKSLGNAERDQARARRKDPTATMPGSSETRHPLSGIRSAVP